MTGWFARKLKHLSEWSDMSIREMLFEGANTTNIQMSELVYNKAEIIIFSSSITCSRWFSQGPPVSSTNKTDSHDIAEILMKVALNTIEQTNKLFRKTCQDIYKDCIGE